jgi:hypothetical protein
MIELEKPWRVFKTILLRTAAEMHTFYHHGLCDKRIPHVVSNENPKIRRWCNGGQQKEGIHWCGGLTVYSGSHVFNGNENSSIGHGPKFISVVCSLCWTCYITLITQSWESSFVTLKLLRAKNCINQINCSQPNLSYSTTKPCWICISRNLCATGNVCAWNPNFKCCRPHVFWYCGIGGPFTFIRSLCQGQPSASKNGYPTYAPPVLVCSLARRFL